MKRKTFIKQAMAAGLPRNLAALFAKEAALRGEPYYFALGRLLNFWAMLRNSIRKALTDALWTGGPVVIPDTARDLWYPFLSEILPAAHGGGTK